MPRPPAGPARAARDGRRHAACRALRQNLSFLAASGAPPVRSPVNAACSLTSDPLGGRRSRQPHASTAPQQSPTLLVSGSLHIARFTSISPARDQVSCRNGRWPSRLSAMNLSRFAGLVRYGPPFDPWSLIHVNVHCSILLRFLRQPRS